jgi:heat shock protein HtpX
VPPLEENRRRGRALYATSVAVVAVLLVVVVGLFGHPFVGLVLGVLAGVAVTELLARRATATALTKAGAVPADPVAYARFHNLVEGLGVASGVAKPDLHVIDDPALNALTVGRDARHAAIAVTTGLLDALTVIELEGVLAHELSHVKALDIVPGTLAVTLVGTLFPGLVPRVVAPRRESVADVTGVAITRYPPGLISALEKLRDDPGQVRSTDRAIAHLWIESPAEQTDHPPLEERIQALREL